MKKIFSFLALLFFTSLAFSQSNELKNLCAKLAENPITKGDFVQTKTINSAKGKRQLKSNGNFIFSLKGIMWKSVKPFPSTMIIGPDYLIQIDAAGNKTITDVSNNQAFANVASTIISVFSNDYELLTKSFETQLINEGSGSYIIRLNPKDSTIASVIGQIDLALQTDQAMSQVTLSSIVMTESSGNTTSYTFSNQSYPKELSKDEQNIFISK
ncbi:MAG: outer membrane lipoprotein carrier protein LolA [Treponema sp.]|nr:outer membrane lipoprotein carrier protein LolA [Treponema sp.]